MKMIPIKCDGVIISSNYGNRTYYYKGKKVSKNTIIELAKLAGLKVTE